MATGRRVAAFDAKPSAKPEPKKDWREPPKLPPPTPDRIAAHIDLCWSLAQKARKDLQPMLDDLAHLETTLADPALEHHPKRPQAEQRYEALCDDVRQPLAAYLGHLVGAEKAWKALAPDDRRRTCVDGLLGIAHTESTLTPALDLLSGWTPPQEVLECLPVELQLLAGHVPF